MKKYDVLIAGAGLAGLSLAKELIGSGMSALVIDRKKRAGAVQYYSSGTFMDPREYGIPGRFLHPIDKAVFCSKNILCSKPVSNCHVIDRAGFYEWMEGFILKDENIKLRYGCEIKEVKYSFGKIKGISYLDHGRQVETTADIYVDCTGASALLGRKTGLTPENSVLALGVERLVPLKEDSNTVYFYTGGNLGSGYGWLFPKSGMQAIAGLGFIDPKLFNGINKEFETMWDKRGLSGLCKRRPIAENHAVLRTGKPLARFTKGNVMVLGDSAHQASPLLGEGIRFILDAAKDAATAIKLVFSSGNSGLIKTYGRSWRKKYHKNFKLLYLIQKVLKAITKNDRLMDKGVKALRCCNEQQYRRVLSGEIDLGFLIFIAVDAWHKIKILKISI